MKLHLPVIVGLLSTMPLFAACTTDSLRPSDDVVADTSYEDVDGMADLVVDSLDLATSLRTSTETFDGSSCNAIEGDFPGGTYRTLRFAVTTANIGDADAIVGDPNKHIDPNGDGDTSDSDGLFVYAPCHGHLHYKNFALYEVLPINPDGTLGAPIQAKKRSFCMVDGFAWSGVPSKPTARYHDCGKPGTNPTPGYQGISFGWADRYSGALDGQYFLLDDPSEPIATGNYLLRVTVNPPYEPEPGETCHARDGAGRCHMIPESNYDNNIAQTRIAIP
jgi:hypothetical protein